MRLSDRLKLRQLEVFVKVVRRKSATQAAEALNMTRPAVDRTIRAPEPVCGCQLLRRPRSICGSGAPRYLSGRENGQGD